eukprot:1804046-Alexandrium_andersonii.AAC.1
MIRCPVLSHSGCFLCISSPGCNHLRSYSVCADAARAQVEWESGRSRTDTCECGVNTLPLLLLLLALLLPLL